MSWHVTPCMSHVYSRFAQVDHKCALVFDVVIAGLKVRANLLFKPDFGNGAYGGRGVSGFVIALICEWMGVSERVIQRASQW